MITKSWKVYGRPGRRQRESFNKSVKYDWSKKDKTRIVEVLNFDKTGTHDYSIIKITRDTENLCLAELDGQISDGVFENSFVGRIEEIV
jgi:hypothetical protein